LTYELLWEYKDINGNLLFKNGTSVFKFASPENYANMSCVSKQPRRFSGASKEALIRGRRLFETRRSKMMKLFPDQTEAFWRIPC